MDGPMETIDGVETGNTVAPNRPTVAAQRCGLDVDALAKEIRRIDGSNSLGAGALAEALMPFLSALPASEAGWREIASVPKDGTPILALNSRHMSHAPVVVSWEDKPRTGYPGWRIEATHHEGAQHFNQNYFDRWMPLPSAPDRRAGE